MSWSAMPLGNAVTLKRGYDLPNLRRIQGDVPVVSSSGITGFHNEAKVAGPGVVTGRYGTLGEVFFIEEDYWPLNTALYVQDFKGNNPRFISYFLRYILRGTLSEKAAVPGVNRNDLHARMVRIPSRGTQQRITNILSVYDDLIENNRRRIRLLEESARLLYKEWFVHLRFPGHEHVKIVDGVPEGWSVTNLAEIAEVNKRSINGRYQGRIRYIDIASVTPGRIGETTEVDFSEAPDRARRAVKHGDIIWSCVRPNRRSHAIVWSPPDNLVASTGFVVITPTKIPTSYLYYFTTTPEFVGYLANNAQGAAYPAVKAKDFEQAGVVMPARSLIEAFDDAAEPCIKLAATLERQNEKLRQARDLLLPRLMSGELAV